jgi:hypothetical protein
MKIAETIGTGIGLIIVFFIYSFVFFGACYVVGYNFTWSVNILVIVAYLIIRYIYKEK